MEVAFGFLLNSLSFSLSYITNGEKKFNLLNSYGGTLNGKLVANNIDQTQLRLSIGYRLD